jgi:hypothetical protein
MVNILNLSKIISKVIANSPPQGVRKNIPAQAPSSPSYVSPEKMLYPQVADGLPPPKKLPGTGSRSGNTPNDKLIDRKELQKVNADKKVSRIDQARILKYKTPVKPPSETTQARKAWKNLLKAPGSVSEEAAGSVRFQYFWSTFKPRTKFNQEIKKRVMNRTMTEKQAILTIKKHRRKVKKQYLKDHKILAKNKKIEDELIKHDSEMYQDGNIADKKNNKGHVSFISAFEHTMQSSLASNSFKNFGKYGEIRLPVKTSFADQEKIVLKTLHDEKVKKINKLDQDAVTLGYGLGGKEVPGWEKSLPASRVADKVLKRDELPDYFIQHDGLIRYGDFESLQFGTERGAFADLSKEYKHARDIPQINKGLSTSPSDKIIKFSLHPVGDPTKRKEGWTKMDDYNAVPEGATNKSMPHIHLDDITPMAFGFPFDKKKNLKKTPLSGQPFNEMLTKADDEFREYNDEFRTLRDTDGNAGLPAGRFYTAGQQSYSRDNAKLWRGIGLGLGGAGAMGLVGGQSAHASHWYDNEPPGSIFSRITPDNMKTMKQQITRRHHTNKNIFGNQQAGEYYDPTGFLSIHDQDLKHKGLPGKKAYSHHRKKYQNSDGTWSFTQNM